MKKWSFALLSLVLAGGLAACGADDDADSAGNDEHSGHGEQSADEGVHPLEVELELPETAAAGEEVTIRAKVTMNDKVIDDADEVEFEIEDESGESEMIEAAFDGTDSYSIDHAFEPGTYKVTSHVTAHQQHTMPKKEITVE
ncbi:FixH family protein [Bhargavaea ullalensis]|uniref:ABC-type glycerol-3-phosphate transport system substrate-binding protein n=1 Tax=Bhargavaea ullalensis TaxID=1265685 RepID=A0ABV2GFD9_9BACL